MTADAFDPAATLRALEEAVASVVVGQDEVVRRTVACLVGSGHALLEGAPGLGKTLLVRTLAAATGLAFGRVQFTPDLLPADVTGTTILVDAPEGRRFEFRAGPLFAHLVLADEVNRATPKAQSALLEAMAEGAVTVAGERHPLPQPFCVLATQNPVEMEGTFPLPEAQLDRFLAKIVVPAPDEAALVEVFRRGATPPAPPVVATPAHIVALADAVRAVAIPEPLLRQVARIVRATDPRGAASTSAARRHLRLGASPRGGEAICRHGAGRGAARGPCVGRGFRRRGRGPPRVASPPVAVVRGRGARTGRRRARRRGPARSRRPAAGGRGRAARGGSLADDLTDGTP